MDITNALNLFLQNHNCFNLPAGIDEILILITIYFISSLVYFWITPEQQQA